MNTALVWVSIIVGLAGTALGAFSSRSYVMTELQRKRGAAATIATILGTVVLFLLTLPTRPPIFSRGQELGYGILIGGLLGVVAGFISGRAQSKNEWKAATSVVSIASLAILGVGIIYLIFSGYPQPALGGFIIGAIMSGVIFRFVIPSYTLIDLWVLSAATLGTTFLLGTLRYDTIAGRHWWPAPLITLAVAAVVVLAASALARRGKFGISAIVATVITLGVTAIFAWKLFPEWTLLWTAIAGVTTFALIAWLGSLETDSPPAAAGIAVLVLAFSAVAFKMMAGFGIGIGMLAAWAILLPTVAQGLCTEAEGQRRPRAVQALFSAMSIGIGILLLRLFMENYSMELSGLDLRAHYTFVAVGIGAIFPFVVMSFFPVRDRQGICWNTIGAIALGFFAAATPLAILVLWGFKSLLGFLLGAITAQIFILLTDSSTVKSSENSYTQTAVLVTAAQVSAVFLSGLVGPLTEQARLVKILILGGLVLLGIIWSIVVAVVNRRSMREA